MKAGWEDVGGSTGGWAAEEVTVGAADAACCLLGNSGDNVFRAEALGAVEAGGSIAREGKTGGPEESCVSRDGKLGAAPPLCGLSGVNGSITRAGAPREAGNGGAAPLALVLRG